MDEIIKRDQDNVTTLAGVTNDANTYIRMLRVDPVSKRLLIAADLSGAAVTSINGLTGAITLAAGTNITLTPVGNVITIAATGGGGGTVTSVGLSLPSFITVSGSPVTTSGTLTGTLATQSPNRIFAGPGSGGAATPTFRTLVLADLPSGTLTAANNGLIVAGGNTVQLGAALTRNTVVDGGNVYQMNFTNMDTFTLNGFIISLLSTAGNGFYSDGSFTNIRTPNMVGIGNGGVLTLTDATTGRVEYAIPAVTGVDNALELTSGELRWNGLLTMDTIINGDGNNYGIAFTALSQWVTDVSGAWFVSSGGRMTFTSNTETQLFADDGAGSATGINAQPTQLQIKTPNINIGTALNGQVLTLTDFSTGQVEYADIPNASSLLVQNIVVDNGRTVNTTTITAINSYTVGSGAPELVQVNLYAHITSLTAIAKMSFQISYKDRSGGSRTILYTPTPTTASILIDLVSVGVYAFPTVNVYAQAASTITINVLSAVTGGSLTFDTESYFVKVG